MGSLGQFLGNLAIALLKGLFGSSEPLQTQTTTMETKPLTEDEKNNVQNDVDLMREHLSNGMHDRPEDR